MLIYVEDLGYDNFKKFEEDIKNSIKEIIRIEELDLTRLSSLVGISRQTVYKWLKNNEHISFRSLNKFNNFLRTYKEKLDHTSVDDYDFEDEDLDA